MVVLYVGDGVTAGVGGQGELFLAAGYVWLEAWITAARATAERIFQALIATRSPARLRWDQGGEEDERNAEENDGKALGLHLQEKNVEEKK